MRKNNSIKKKKELKLQQQISNLKDPILNEVSKNILSQNGDYIPIQERAGIIHNLHQLHVILNENRNKVKKVEMENEECLKIEKYRNKRGTKKIFNQNDWNNFIQNQEHWYKQKFLKKKAIELMRENIEKKIKHKPKINYNSKKIINNIRKNKENDEDNIYDKLYNDYNYMQERKKLKISNSMPSFKPLLNKGIKKNMFKNNNNINNNIYTNKNIEKQIEAIIQQKLNKIKNKNKSNNNINNSSKLSNQTFVKHLSNINFNNKQLKSPNNKNKIKNISKDSYVYRKNMCKKLAKKN